MKRRAVIKHKKRNKINFSPTLSKIVLLSSDYFPTLSEILESPMKVCRRETFNAAHRLFVKEWSDEKNRTVFGKCSNPNYHGHNYILETWVEGEVNPVTGYVIDLAELKEVIRKEISHRFDHRNLNLDCPEFEGKNPTAENIAVVIWNLLRVKLPKHLKLSVRLSETENNWVEFGGGDY